MKFQNLITGVVAILVLGCASQPPMKAPILLTDPSLVAAQTTVIRDAYKKTTNFESPNSTLTAPVLLRAWRSDVSGVATYQIYVTSVYGSAWRFYDEGYDSDGQRFDVTLIERHVEMCSASNGCYFHETVGLNVTRAYLDKHKSTGIDYKISGKAGEAQGFVPPAYIQGFLVAVDANVQSAIAAH